MSSPQTLPNAESKGEDAAPESPSALLLIKRLQMITRALTDESLRSEGLTALQYVALTFIRYRGPLSSADLARRCAVRPQTMHGIIKGYIDRGLVHKQPDPASKRSLLLALTEEGIAALQRSQPAVEDLEERMLAGMSAGQRIVFRECLQQAISQLSAEADVRHVTPFMSD